MQLDTESLRAFVQVADLGHVTRVAQQLNLTQSAVSHKLKRLEIKVGEPLFSRFEGRLQCTSTGQDLLSYARRIVELHDEAAAQMQRQSLSGKLRLGITQNVNSLGVANILSRFARLYPEVTLTTKVGHSPQLLEWVQGAQIDLALVNVFADQIGPHDHVLWQEDLVWVQAAEMHWQDFGYLPLITFYPNCFYHAWAIEPLQAMGVAVKEVLECPFMDGVVNAVRSGLGVTLLNRAQVGPGMEIIRKGLPPAPSFYHVARFARAKSSPQASALLDTITSELAVPS